LRVFALYYVYTGCMPKRPKLIFQIAALIAFICAAFWLAEKATGSDAIQALVKSYGYVGIFIVAMVSGFNLVLPVPAASFMPLFLESGLSFWPTIFLISLGMTFADSIAFLLAKAGKQMVSENAESELFRRFQKLPEKYYRYPLAALFIFASIAPLPNEFLLIPAALFFGYSLIELAPILFAGNMVFNILFAKGLIGVFHFFSS
jgi:membrane protein YqaA with SNARE-associated domain